MRRQPPRRGSGKDARAFGYDALHRLSSNTLTSGSGAQVAAISYGYDAADQLTSRTTSGFAGGGTSTYGYDLAGRLTSWTNTPSATGVATTTPYAYDDDGNRTGAGSTTYTYDARDQLVSDGASTYGYTARGTTTGSTVTTTGFTTASAFDAFGQEISAGGITYGYDALGRATSAGGTPLAYSGQDNTVAADGTGTYTHDSGGSLVAVAPSAAPATLAFTDLHTDLVGEYAPDGTALTGSAAYDPWGTPTVPSTLAGSIGYQSEYTDPASGQVNMHARWYTPATGTFTSADTAENPAVGTSAAANPFAYGNASPLNGTDPTGHNWAAALDALEGVAGVEAANGANDWNPVGWATAAGIAVVGGAYVGYKYYQSHSGPSSHTAYDDFAWTSSSVYSNPIYTYQPYAAPSFYARCASAWSLACDSNFGNPKSSPKGTHPRTPHGLDPRAIAAAAAAAAAARAAAIKHKAEQLTNSIGNATLTTHSSAVAASPTIHINIPDTSSAVKNTAYAIGAGIATAAACEIVGCKFPKDSISQNCSAGAGEGWQVPLPLDAQDRATGMLVCVTSSSLQPSGTSPVTGPARAALSGYGRSQNYVDNVMGLDSAKVVNACHLVADTLGGSGADQRNLATCFRGVNTNDRSTGSHGRNNMAIMEKRVKKAALAGQSVTYLVIPQYRNASSKVPYRFFLSAQGYYSGGVPGLRSTMVIDNTYGPAGVNLGYVIK